MTQTKRPNYVLWMLCVFMLLSAASYFFRPKEPEISYAEVVQLFEQEKVKSFTVQDTTLTLKLREAVDGKTELRKELYDFDLFYDDLNDLVVEQKAAGILDTAAARCAAIRQDAAQKADKLKTERMQKAKADLAAAKQSAETAAAAEQRTAQQKTAALAEDIRKKAQQNSANVIRAIREAITG